MTLTELSYYSRRFAPFGVLLFLVFLLFYYAIRLLFVFVDVKKPTTLRLDTKFGKINEIQIPETTPSSGLTFTLDTVEGAPVTASAAARVIFIPPTSTSFGYREKIILMAKNLGFDTDSVEYKLTDREAVFDDGKQKFSVDISNFNFTYEYFFDQEPEIFGNTREIERSDGESRAIDFLRSLGSYPDELTMGKTNTVFMYYNPEDRTISPLEASANSNMVEVDFYRPEIDTVPIVTSKYFNSQNFVVLTDTERGIKVLRAQVRFFEKSDSQVGIYPLKTGKQAYDALTAGRGFVVSNPVKDTNITIRRMFLGYYDPDLYLEYLQPVYVFLGDNNFVAYVSAVSDEYLAK